ncbi:anhydro-N-acetylmuramic acid kinase [Candidatus Halobeggiatoa sp. HSG11]|nr:anhydro-N-acetylmuramic acid kinase [Candidatus Halobeggiatoa sp. HSG11]
MYIGLMSGTSIDAIDVILADFVGNEIHIHAVYSHPWPQDLRDTLLTLSQETKDQSILHDIAILDVKVGKLFAKSVLNMLEKNSISKTKIHAIGSPGQTLYHHPDGNPSYTWQLGDPNVIAQMTNITTIADFRRRDVAAGGQGAPLAPAFHDAYMRSSEENRGVLNIGGIGNLTVLSADKKLPVIGFDTGPGNALLDAFAYQQQHLRIDKDGAWAASGQVHADLLKDMLEDEYFARPAPKSTGRDYFNLEWLSYHILGLSLPPEDIQATLCQLTIDSIANSVTLHNIQRLLVCGGGVHNSLLMQGLADKLPDCKVESTEAIGINPDLVEAICFAWLAKQRLNKQPSNLSSVTGAEQPVVLGGVYL